MLNARPITLEDLPLPAPAPDILGRMRSSHHSVARMLAEGKRVQEVAAVSGYAPATISSLQNDPTFANLVALYKENVQACYVNTHQRMDALATDAVDELHHRLRETPNEFTVPQLESIAKSFLDRVGFGPTKTVNVTSLNAQVTPDDLARIRAQTASRGEVRQLDETPAEAGDRIEGGLAPAFPALVHTPVAATEVLQETGSRLRAEGDGASGE